MSSFFRDESFTDLVNSCRNKELMPVLDAITLLSGIPRRNFKFQKNSKLLNINIVREDVTNILQAPTTWKPCTFVWFSLLSYSPVSS